MCIAKIKEKITAAKQRYQERKLRRETIKDLHAFVSDLYKAGAEAYLNNYITSEDVYVYIDNESTMLSRIHAIKDNLQNKEISQKYKAIKDNNLQIDDTIAQIQGTISILELEYKRVSNAEVNSPQDAQTKLKSLNDLEKRIAANQKFLEQLDTAKSQYVIKRKVGRPKKHKGI